MRESRCSRVRRFGVVSVLAFVQLSATARIANAKWRKYAIIVGYNGVVPGTGRDRLDYADDDAVRNGDLWQQLRTDVSLLTLPDRDTRQRFPDAAPTGVPTLAAVKEAVADINRKAAADRAAGHFTVTYFAYSGHGGMLDGDGYITLADGPLGRLDFYEDVLAALQTDRVHVIIDACSAAAMVRGGDATEVRPFLQPIYRAERSHFKNAGFLLPSSSPTQTYEWRRYRGGVFGYLVRSGLRGAADADGDGRISYREIESFVARAQADVDGEFRPATMADPPPDDDTFLYLDPTPQTRSLLVDVNLGDHLYVADAAGNRHFDLRPGNQAFRLLLPSRGTRLFAVNLDKRLVYELPGDQTVVLSALSPRPFDESTPRGPGAEFEKMFAAAYDFHAHLTHQHSRANYDREAVAIDARVQGRRNGIVWMLAASAGVTATLGAGVLASSYWKLQSIEPSDPVRSKSTRRRTGRQLAGGGLALVASAAITASAAAIWHFAFGHEERE